jgi:drug/metabolite transporter (DMT)-like permease
VLNELWAKISAREKMVVYGAGVAVIAWLIGVVLATKSYGGGSISGIAIPGYSINFFTNYHGMDLGLIAMLAALAAAAAIYVKNSPTMNITWPAPFPTVLLALSGLSLACAALMTLLQLTSGIGVGDWPIFAWVAVIGMLAGGALMSWSAYQEYVASKTA